jgi:hypothetical protein
MIKDANRIFDGFNTLEGGVDSGRRSNIIGRNQVVSAENAIFRGGRPGTRPGIRKLARTITNPNQSYNADGTLASLDIGPVPGQTASTVFPNGTFQSACYYAAKGGQESLICLVGGRLFKLIPGDNTVQVTEIPMPYRNRSMPKAYIIQADKFIIGQDGESLAIIYDGVIARRAVDGEVVIGTIMSYGMGRLVVISNNFQDIFFGDLYASHPGIDGGDSIIQFTETQLLSGGFPASIPFALGPITGAAFFPQLDTSTGEGEMMVFTRRGAASFFLSLPRSQWQTSDFQKIALKTTGLRGWRSIADVNEDLFFRSTDGERSFRQARAEPTGWHHLPLSTNIGQWFDADTPYLLDYASAIYFDNRILATVTPVYNHNRPYHNGLVVLDFDILSSFGANLKPAWNGHWSNPQVRWLQLVIGTFNGTERAFAFGLDENNTNQLYEITLDDIDDFNGPIKGEIISRSFDFSSSQASDPFSEKELYMGDIWLSDIAHPNFGMDISYRPDNYPYWLPWDSFSGINPFGHPGDVDDETGVPTLQLGYVPRRTLKKPDLKYDQTVPDNKRDLRRGFEFQTKFNWMGHCTIDRFRIHAQQLTEKTRAR